MGTYSRFDLNAAIEAYNVRGVVGEGIDADFVGAIDTAFGRIIRPEGTTCAAVNHDMREPLPGLAASFADDAAAQGLNVTLLGLTSTDELYLAFEVKGCSGAMLTTSHNPTEYDDIKMCRPLVRPIRQETGFAQIKDLLVDGIPGYTGTPGEINHEDALQDYAVFLHGLVDIRSDRHLKVAVDAGSGMGRLVVPAVLGEGMDAADLYFELGGNFPNHEASPLEPVNLVDLQKFTMEQDVDIGIAFDGNADRCFVVGEEGNLVSPSAICALVATRYPEQNPGATIIHNLIILHVVPEMIMENGGTSVHTRVGHPSIRT